ncbi:type 1 glutamine amidotransferase domain-containing protein [Amycolatopsis benzoatilytica]|uniref:type 1 glutamine amidotransferase domain-containing protein n=1 Tax=Amycolatopsis benzoatilytica TaxID=346045 RepID=UPI00036FD5C1|nr:type 1 glutamine amidotransferase domain-containing protein [Amycolatopsis benzoatilytica]
MARVAVLVDEMVEDDEFRVPCERLRAAGHEPVVVGLKRGKELTALHGTQFTADQAVDDVGAADFDGVVVPGGYSPDKIRTNESMIALVRETAEAGKPVAAVCHGPWLLAEAGLARGRTLTSWPSLRTDLRNAGAEWVDREVVADGDVITSRNPGDLDAFCDVLLERLK